MVHVNILSGSSVPQTVLILNCGAYDFMRFEVNVFVTWEVHGSPWNYIAFLLVYNFRKCQKPL